MFEDARPAGEVTVIFGLEQGASVVNKHGAVAIIWDTHVKLRDVQIYNISISIISVCTLLT